MKALATVSQSLKIVLSILFTTLCIVWIGGWLTQTIGVYHERWVAAKQAAHTTGRIIDGDGTWI